jgi:hypothetical protein
METSNSMTKIAPALLAAQKAMTAAAKAAVNPHFKSKYADLATVIDAVKEPLNAAGITFLQTIGNDTTGVTVRTTLVHESGEWIAATTYLPVPQQTPQAFGSGITYAKRYGLQSICGLPSEDDDGERASEPEKADAHRVEKRPNTATQVAKDAFDEMSAADQKYLQDLSIAVIDMCENGDDANGFLERQKLSIEHKLAIWSLLPSNVRSALKKAQAAANAAKKNGQFTPSELAGQAYEGKANIGGTMYRVAGWIKEGKNGKWLSLNIEVPRAAQPAGDGKSAVRKPTDDSGRSTW